MTDVEEALEIMTDMELSHCAVDCGDDIEQVDIFDIVDQDKWEKIKSNLQRAAECEKLISPFPRSENPAIGRPTYKFLYDEQQERITAQDRIVVEATNRAHRLEIENKHLKNKAQGLVKALEMIDKTLQIPAAEYVPAISNVFTIIDEALAAFNSDEIEKKS